jgi:hypothetical protein
LRQPSLSKAQERGRRGQADDPWIQFTPKGQALEINAKAIDRIARKSSHRFYSALTRALSVGPF